MGVTGWGALLQCIAGYQDHVAAAAAWCHRPYKEAASGQHPLSRHLAGLQALWPQPLLAAADAAPAAAPPSQAEGRAPLAPLHRPEPGLLLRQAAPLHRTAVARCGAVGPPRRAPLGRRRSGSAPAGAGAARLGPAGGRAQEEGCLMVGGHPGTRGCQRAVRRAPREQCNGPCTERQAPLLPIGRSGPGPARHLTLSHA